MGYRAGALGFKLALSSSNSLVASTNPTVTVPAGQKSVSFKVTTYAVATSTTATITATANGASHSATLTVKPATLLSVLFKNATTGATISSLTGGSQVKVVVAISAAAPASGASVSLVSSNKTLLALPASITVPSGSTQATITLTTGKVKSGTSSTVTATASYQGTSRAASLKISN